MIYWLVSNDLLVNMSAVRLVLFTALLLALKSVGWTSRPLIAIVMNWSTGIWWQSGTEVPSVFARMARRVHTCGLQERPDWNEISDYWLASVSRSWPKAAQTSQISGVSVWIFGPLEVPTHVWCHVLGSHRNMEAEPVLEGKKTGEP